jgi:ATP-binding cassette subfamily B protein
MNDAVTLRTQPERITPSTGQIVTLLSRYIKPQRFQVFGLAVLLLGGIGLQLANPQVIRYFLDTAESGAGDRALFISAGLFLGFALLRQILSVLTVYFSETVSWTATNHLRKDLTIHCLNLDMSFHKRHAPGELIERIDGDVTGLANLFSQFIIRVFGNGLLVAGILFLLLLEDLRVGIGLAIYTGLIVLFMNHFQRVVVPLWISSRQARADMFGFLEERISGVEDIRAIGAEEYVLNRLFRLMRTLLEKTRAAFILGGLVFNLANLLFALSYAFGLAMGVYLYLQGQASIGTAFLIVYYTGMLSDPLQSLREQMQDLQRAMGSIQRIQELFEIQPQVREPVESNITPLKRLREGPLSVEFHKVSFRYDQEDHVLNDISFHLQPGKILGILGRTGSGKSTLTRLLFRLYDPAEGVIRLDGMDVREAAISDLRSRVALVTQDVQLFQASIRDNLAFFNEDLRDEQIIQALKNLYLWDWFNSLPYGLDTRLAAAGESFSAGEAQLLALTRVMLKDPGVVILDEASSRLDPATENRLERGFDKLFQKRTGMIIAHRLKTVQRADEILILENGRVIESGPRLLLQSNPASRFSGLLRTGFEEVLA